VLFGDIAELFDILFGNAQLNGLHAATCSNRLGNPANALPLLT
jgi:hypothetical protein